MSSYIRKLKNKTKDKELYYYNGCSVKFNFYGDRSWRVAKSLHHFSNDDHIVWEGEDKNGYIGDVIGINKERWRFTNE